MLNLKEADRNFTGPDERDRYPSPRFINSKVTNAFVLKNTKEGYSYTLTGKLEKTMDKNLGGFVAYTFGVAKDIQSVGSTVQANMPTVNGQNFLDLSYSDNDLRHRIVGYLNYKFDYGKKVGGTTTISLGMVSNSGFNISYVYGSDLNGDGQTNDLLYIPKNASELTFAPLTVGSGANAVVYSPEEQAAAFDKYISNNKYLDSRRGNYAERNGDVFPWLHRFNLSVIQDIWVKVGKRETKNKLQLRIDILNVGNMINNEWGVGSVSTTTSPLTVVTPITDTPSFRLRTQKVGDKTVLLQDSYQKSITIDNAWQAQFGIRYSF